MGGRQGLDSQIDVLLGMQAMLSAWGCIVLIARSLAALASHLETSQRFPDPVICDHILPDGSSGAVIEALLLRLVPVAVPMSLVTAAIDSEAAKSTDTGALRRLLADQIKRSAA